MDRYLIAGLGNPGMRYKNNRHNAGFIVIDGIGKELGLGKFTRSKGSKVSKLTVGGDVFFFMKPQLFMNNSGRAVIDFMRKEDISSQNLIVIYDDTDLSFGTVRYRAKGSAGTHNGMRSVVSAVGTEDFRRIRIGIGRPDEGTSLTDHVLRDFDRQQLRVLKEELVHEIYDKLFKDVIRGENG